MSFGRASLSNPSYAWTSFTRFDEASCFACFSRGWEVGWEVGVGQRILFVNFLRPRREDLFYFF